MTGDPGRLPTRRKALLAAVSGLVVAVVAAALRAPGVLYADSGELLTAVARNGVAHPPGFPLYLLLGGLFLDATSFLRASAASRLNLFSSLSDGVTAGAITAAALVLFDRVASTLRTSARVVLAVLAGFLAGFGPTLFDFSLGIEVYALHAALLSSALAFAAVAGGEDDPARRRRATLLSGLFAGGGLAVHHATMVVSLPGLALLLWGREAGRDRLRRAGLFGAALLPGLATYALLPLRAAKSPPLNWGNPSNLFRFWVHVSAHDYQVNLENSLDTILGHAGRFLDAYLTEFSTLGLLVALLGAVVFARKGRLAGAGLAAVIVGDIAFAVRYEIAEDQAAYYIPTFLATALLAALGIGWLTQRAGARSRRLGAASFGALVLVLSFVVARNVAAHAGRARDRRAPESAENLLGSLPPGALAFTPEWNLYAPVMGLREVEGKRPDVLFLDLLLLRRGWYLDAFRLRFPDRYAEVRAELDAYRAKLGDWEEGRPYGGDQLTALYNGFTQALVRAAWKRGAAVAWIGTLMTQHLPAGATLEPCGLSYRVLRSKEEAIARIEDAPLYLRAAFRPGLPRDDVFEQKIRPLYVGMLTQRALYEEAFHQKEEAASRLDLARRLDPSNAEAAEAAADLLAGTGKYAEALDLYAEALRNGGDGARIAEKSRAAVQFKNRPPATPAPRSSGTPRE